MGFLAKIIFRYSKASKIAKRNIHRIYKDKSQQKIYNLIDDIWTNLGKSFAEACHFYFMDDEEFFDLVKINGFEKIEGLIKDKKPFILMTAHYSNWEVQGSFLSRVGMYSNTIYRRLNNFYLDKYFLNIRKANFQNVNFYDKGSAGVKAISKAVKEGEVLVVMVDQKYNEGVNVPFMGYDAMMASFPAKFALKHNLPVFPIHTNRCYKDDDAYFRISISDQLKYKKTKDSDKDAKDLLAKMNKEVASWIDKSPAEWFWVHNRWK